LTPLDAKSSQNSDNELELMLSELDQSASNWNAVQEWMGRVGPLEQSGVNELHVAREQMDYALERSNKHDLDKAREHLKQADEQTHKALASAVASISGETQQYADDFGEADFNDHFRHYQDLSGVLVRITRQIENAQQSREQQDALYRDVAEGADFKDLLKYYDELRGSEDAIGDSIKKERRRYRNLFLISGVGIVATIATAAIGLAALL